MGTRTDEDYGPVMRGRASPFARKPLEIGEAPAERKPPPRRARRIGKVLLALLVVIPLLVVLAGFGMLLYASSQIERQEVAGLAPSRPLTVLVTGTDSREGMTREQQRELNTGSEAVGADLTDTIFLLQASGGRTAMLAFPRDLFVTRCDGSQGRINAASRIGGPGCLVETITDLSGIPISHHLEVNFLGFRDIVDAVGGVEVCLDRPIQDGDAGIDLPAGCQRLEGPDALGYVRVRKIDNDLERIRRQQTFVRALASEILSRDVLTSPTRLFDTTTAVAGAVTADSRLGPFDIGRLAWALRGLADGLDNAHTVPATEAVIGGASVLQVSQPAADGLFDDFRDGDLLAAAEPSEEALMPEDVELVVLNGARVAGLAGQVAEQLRTQGFVIRDVGNADTVDATIVRYPPGQRAAAELLVSESGRPAELVEDAEVSTVTLVLGRDAAG